MHPDQVLKGNTCRYFVGWVEFSTASQGQKKICTMSKLFSCIICLSVEYEIYHDSTYYSLYLLLVFNHKIHLAELSESCISYLRGVQKKLSNKLNHLSVLLHICTLYLLIIGGLTRLHIQR